MDNNQSVGSQQAQNSQETQQDQDAICVPINDDGGATHAATSSSFFKFVFPYVVTFLVTLVTFVCSIVAAVVVLPLLLACFLVIRFFQCILALRHDYDKSGTLKVVIQLKLLLRIWIYIDSAYLMCLLLVLYGVAQLVPQLGLKYAHFLGRSITHWIETYFIVFGMCIMSYIVSIIMIRFVIFNIPAKYHTFLSSGHVVSDTVHETIDCFTLFFLTEQEVVIRTSTLKQHNILGFYPIHRLLHVLILLFVFNYLTRLSIHIILRQLQKLITGTKNHPHHSFHHLIATKFWGRGSVMYWANGTLPSIMFTLTSLMLLLTWVCYVGPQLGGDHRLTRDKKVLNFGTWTCLCLFIFSLLWVIKTYILLLLEIRSIYNRLGLRISPRGKKLFLLGIIGRHKFDILKIRYSERRKPASFILKFFKFEITKKDIRDLFSIKQGVSLIMLSLFPILWIKDKTRYQDPIQDSDDEKWGELKLEKADEYYVEKLSLQKKNQASEDLLRQEIRDRSMKYELQKMVHYFVEAKQSLSQDNYTFKILKYLQKRANAIHHGSIKETLYWLTDGEIERHINGVESQKSSGASKEVTHDANDHVLRSFLNIQNIEDLKIWMTTARNECVYMANRMSGAKRIVECLDKVLSVLIIVVTVILWLLLTKLASIKFFVIIGSPIIAFSFIFGDAAKTFFQGIVFIYMVQPFQVGDLCVIDEKMMEVISIDVWETTFSKVDTREEVIHPNSELLNKEIINHKEEFDWNDYVELYVGSTDRTKAYEIRKEIELMDKIKMFLQHDHRYESTRGGVEVVMTAADNNNNIKLRVNYRCLTDIFKKSMTYYECFWEKRRLRSELVQELVRNLLVAVDNNDKGKTKEQIIRNPMISAAIPVISMFVAGCGKLNMIFHFMVIPSYELVFFSSVLICSLTMFIPINNK